MESPPAEPLDARAQKRIRNKRYYAANKAKLNKYSQEYQKAHRLRLYTQKRARYVEFEREKKHAYYRRNRERILHKKREYYVQKRHIIDAWRKCNAKKLSADNSRWHRENRDRVRGRKRQESRRRRDRVNDRIAYRFRRRIRRSVKNGGVKPAKSVVLLGCSFDEFREYLERQFRRCMTWKNYGRAWHIDHIIPCSAFDLTRPEHVRQCFHFTNLRPLWARANLRKGSKITDPQLKLLL